MQSLESATASTKIRLTNEQRSALSSADAPRNGSHPRYLLDSKRRSDLEIVGAILRAASKNGGEPLGQMRRSAGLTFKTISRYVRFMIDSNLLSAEVPLEGDGEFGGKIYRPTEFGYAFLLKHKQLLELLEPEEASEEILNYWG
jgi:predicted transcriptional regulator